MKKQKTGTYSEGKSHQSDIKTYGIIYAHPERETLHLIDREQIRLNARMARWFYDYELKQTIWSDGVYEILGLDPRKTEPDYYKFLEIIHPEDRHLKITADKNLQNTTKPIEINYRLHSGNNRIKWINEICGTDFKSDGSPARSFGTLQDITQYKIKEENFRIKEERINKLIDLYPSVVAICNNNKFAIINEAGKELFGEIYAAGLIGKPAESIINGAVKERFRQKMELAAMGKKLAPFDSQVLLAGDQTLEVNITLIPASYSGNNFVQLVINDVSKQKEAEKKLADSEKRFNFITERLTAFSWSIDLAGNITEIFPDNLLIFGYQRKDLINHNISRFLSAEIYPSVLRKILNSPSGKINKGNKKQILDIIAKDGSRTWIEISTVPIIDSNNYLTGFNGIGRDISERIKTENLLRKNQERLNELIAAKDRFFSVIAHDLRAPFNSILGFIDFLGTNFEEIAPDERTKYFKLIEDNVENTLKMLENLLDWARTQTGKHIFQPEKFKVKVLIDEAVKNISSVASQKSQNLKTNIPENQSIRADYRMLLTVLNNLLSNAIKFSYENSCIEIEVTHSKRKIKFSILDHGIGISKEKLGTLFKVGNGHSTAGTAQEKGSGLGLILCKEFIEIHHGEIEVQSEPGKGSVFSFTIPDL